ncbi:3,4-dihydroxy-2-butanone-4-phosphate synthase [Luteipulveratus sp. YIM 133132]|uniref:3,4-dihydroxy-2-butanone-4-phosphate synthase n=1 Tax=Luteipulveratus flavus TaxID=3031728 RepID=UPI0023B1D325|nr:3,4-dihydroxy-2-butanone-4-phosphate synthase [Luteipulveratus sp. YIM 133132]MDE9366032.1 3,4-dihydroxy-2-butanone-4-phosphate synthase [Luteipulveratus sp. YIM 133132]
MTRATIEQALHALRLGRPVLVLDDEDRENEGDVVLAAATATEEWVGWAVRHGSGLICAPMTDEVADRLALPLMVGRNEDSLRTAYTVTVDAAAGVTTGISAADRTRTLQVLADASAGPTDVIRPGHVLPLRARPGGVLARPGHTEAAVDLCRLAGLAPVGAIVELVHDDGSMMRAPAVHALAEERDLPVITIEQLITWRQRNDRVQRVARTVLPTEHGSFDLVAYTDRLTGSEVLALVSPRGVGEGAVLTRLHSECLTGDALGSQRCDCGPQLQAAMARVAAEGGVVVYVRGHEGRGVGLVDKLRAYELQDAGRDTVDAQIDLGLPVDAREFHAATAVLADLGVESVRLLTNNPAKVEAVTGAGLTVHDVVPLVVGTGAHNAHYLRTKRDRLGHTITHPRGAVS